jgi:hypothetical protein
MKDQEAERYTSSEQMSLEELIHAHMQGELKPSPEAERRLRALTDGIQQQGIVFEDADVAMRRIRRRWEFDGEEVTREGIESKVLNYLLDHVGDAATVRVERQEDRWVATVVLPHRQKVLGQLVFSHDGTLLSEESHIESYEN